MTLITFSDNAYTLETLPMDKDSLLDIAEFMYEETYRTKWLWLTRYLRLVGSDTNKSYALLVQSSLDNSWTQNDKNRKIALMKLGSDQRGYYQSLY